MPDRPRIPVVFGEGLNRASGKTVVRPGAMRDLRNVVLFEGKAQVRRGLEEVSTFLDAAGDPMTDILAIHPHKSQNGGIVVAYNSVNGYVQVFTVDSNGTNPKLVDYPTSTIASAAGAVWFSVAPGDDPPIVMLADSYSKVFMAHSEREIKNRTGNTVYYDWVTNTLIDLEADLDGNGLDKVYFRGVAKYHDYLLGWGFGSTLDPDRAETVRTSMPGDPTSWKSEHYWLAGQRNEAVLNVVQVGQVAVVLKETELYQIFGYSRDSFGIRPLDGLFGLVGARLVMYYDGALYFWSQDGPRVTDGQSASKSISIALDLPGFEPVDLSRTCDPKAGFCALRPERRIIEFIFGTHSYALSFMEPSNPKWSYQAYGVPLNCFGLLYQTEYSAVTAPSASGYPKCYGTTAVYDYSATVRIEKFGITPPNAIIEVFIREHGGSWATAACTTAGAGVPCIKQAAVSGGINAGIYQDFTFTGLTEATTYDIAMRYRVGGAYGTEWSDNDPDNWTGTATASVCDSLFTTSQDLRKLDSVVWSRFDGTTEYMTLSFSSPAGAGSDTTDVEKSTDGITYAPVAGSPVVAGTWTHVYTAAGSEGETYLWFRVKPSAGSTWSNVISRWVGPQQPIGYASNSVNSPEAVGLPPVLTTYAQPDNDPLNPGVDPNFCEIVLNFVPGGAPVGVGGVEWQWQTENNPGWSASLFALHPLATDGAADIPRGEGYIEVRIRAYDLNFTVTDVSQWNTTRKIAPWSGITP